MKLTIQLDVYSGRPNPEWELENEKADSLYNMLHHLPVCKNPGPTDGLGYRGFVVHSEKETIHVYAGMIWINEKIDTIWIDKNQVEQLCLQMAKEKGYGKIIDMFGLQ